MAQIIQPSFVQLQNPLEGVGNAVAQGVLAGYANRKNEKLNEFNTLTKIAATQFPDEQGGFTAALNSQDPAQRAAAEQFLGTYMDSFSRVAGRKIGAKERTALAGALANGMLSTRQLVNRAQGLALLPEQGELGTGAGQAPVAGQEAGVSAGMPAAAGAGPVGPVGAVQQQTAQTPSGFIGAGNLGRLQAVPAGYTNMEVAPSSGPVSPVAAQLGAGPLGEQTPPPGVAPQDRRNVTGEFQMARALGTTPEGLDQGVRAIQASQEQIQLAQQILQRAGPAQATAEYQKAQARIQAGQATQIERNYVAGYEALQKLQVTPKGPAFGPGAVPGSNGAGVPSQVPQPERTQERLRSALTAAPAGERGKFLVKAMKVPEAEAQAAADEVSEPTAQGRAIDLGPAGKLELSGSELRSVERGVSGTTKVLDAALEAKGPDLGPRVVAAQRALSQTASLVPGAKLFSQAWARNVVETIRNASVEDLTAMGLNEEARIFLDNDKDKRAAERNDIDLFTVLSRTGADLTQLEFQRDIAKIQYAAAAAQATGTAAGVEFAEKAKVFTALVDAAQKSAGGKPLNGAQYRKFFSDSGFNEIADWAEGSFGGAGAVVTPARQGFFAPLGNILMGSTLGVREPSATEAGPFGATPAAELGMRAAGLLGPAAGAGPTGSTSESSRGSILGAFGNGQSAMQQYQNNVARLYQDWQAMLASRGR